MDALHHLTVATGYIELGLYLDANAELDEIAPELRACREVLELRLRIYRALGKAELAEAVSRALGRAA